MHYDTPHIHLKYFSITITDGVHLDYSRSMDTLCGVYLEFTWSSPGVYLESIRSPDTVSGVYLDSIRSPSGSMGECDLNKALKRCKQILSCKSCREMAGW